MTERQAPSHEVESQSTSAGAKFRGTATDPPASLQTAIAAIAGGDPRVVAPGGLRALQKAVGNRSLARLVDTRSLQRKVGDPIGKKRIVGSVGRGGYNFRDDVSTIQYLLGHVPADDGGPASPIAIDGANGGPNFEATVAAILRFQQSHDGLSQDARVDPGEATLARLNTYDSSFYPVSPGEIAVPKDDPPAPLPDPGGPRQLTTSQHQLLEGVFGDKLDYSKIQIVPNALLGAGSTRTVGNTIDLQGSTIDDTTLVHEATHVYQYQRGDHYAASSLSAQAWSWLTHWGDRNFAYDYADVESKKVPFDKWNSEQQAEWVAINRRLPPSRKGEEGYP